MGKIPTKFKGTNVSGLSGTMNQRFGMILAPWIHVWYIHLHLVDCYGFHVKNTISMDFLLWVRSILWKISVFTESKVLVLFQQLCFLLLQDLQDQVTTFKTSFSDCSGTMRLSLERHVFRWWAQ